MKKIKDFKFKIVLTLGYILLVVLFYLFDFKCVFKQFLNIECPGCGMTRAMLSVLKFDFVNAFRFHCMFWSIPILYLYFLYDGKLFKNRNLNILVIIFIVLGFILNWLHKIMV